MRETAKMRRVLRMAARLGQLDLERGLILGALEKELEPPARVARRKPRAKPRRRKLHWTQRPGSKAKLRRMIAKLNRARRAAARLKEAA